MFPNDSLLVLILCSAKLDKKQTKKNKYRMLTWTKLPKFPHASSLSMVHEDSMAIHLRFLTAIELFQHSNKYVEHKIFRDAFKRGEYGSYNSAFLASISNNGENCTNVHYVNMTAVEPLNFSGDKFSFSSFLPVVALTNVIKAPVNVLCNAGVDIRLLAMYNCRNEPEREEKPEILFCLSSDNFVSLMKESFFSQTSESSLSRPIVDDTDTWPGIQSQIGILESSLSTGRKPN